MTALSALIAQRIQASGPMTLADFMAECLLHPEHGYYTTRIPFGAEGDFTTAPEISQMFGELIGLALAQAWLDQGAPETINLVELGPGRGTLMADILRAARAVPGFAGAAHVHLVEASPRLRAVQRETLRDHAVEWHDHLESVPKGPLFLVANEFFDVLPIRQFLREGKGWRERQVGVVDGTLRFGLSAPVPLAALEHRLADTGDGDVVEVCPALGPIVGGISARIAEHRGAALIVDYGDWRSKGDTFQAVEAHDHTDPLARPGHADLTAHVDFEAIAHASKGVAVSPMVPQGVFLERLGITPRAQKLAAGLREDALTAHIAAHRRLTHPEEMGSLFKVIALTPHGAPGLPGLDP